MSLRELHESPRLQLVCGALFLDSPSREPGHSVSGHAGENPSACLPESDDFVCARGGGKKNGRDRQSVIERIGREPGHRASEAVAGPRRRPTISSAGSMRSSKLHHDDSKALDRSRFAPSHASAATG